MNKYLFIVNPTSGKGKGSKVLPLIKQFAAVGNNSYTIETTKYPNHAREIAEEKGDKFDFIVAVGGDGTVNEVINGINTGARSVLSVLPVGSGNDFVKNLKYPKNIKDTLSFLTNSAEINIIQSDVGIVKYYDNESDDVKYHKFINNLGIGFDAYVGYLNQSNKSFSGLTSYIFAVFKALLKYKMIEIDYKDEKIQIKDKKLMISIGNGISSGGGFYLNPNAKINDSLLDISIFDSITRRRLLTALPLALLNKVESIPEAQLLTSNRLEIKLEHPYFAHCDGEIISEKLISAEVHLEASSIKVISNTGD